MSSHLWNRKKASLYTRSNLKNIFDIAMQRYLMPKYAKAFAIFVVESYNQSSRHPSPERMLQSIKKATIEKYSQQKYIDAYDRLMAS